MPQTGPFPKPNAVTGMQERSGHMTQEEVAFQLMMKVMAAEGRPLDADNLSSNRIPRRLILDAYSECLAAVQGERGAKIREPVK